MKKLLPATLGIAAATVLATGSALAGSVKVGSLAAVTGPIPELIGPVAGARVTAAKIVNDQGGLSKGKYELVAYDSKCDAKSAVDAATKAINVDRVIAVIGGSCSGATIAAATSVVLPAGLLQLSDTASAPSITNLDDNDMLFRVATSDAYQGVALAKAVMAEGVKKVAVTFANDDYNIGISKVFIEAFKGMGGKVTAEQMHEPKKASYRSELSTLSKSGADVLIVFSYYGSGGLTILRNSLENGFFEKFYGAESMMEDKMIEQLGYKNLKGIYKATSPYADSESKAFKAYAKLGVKDHTKPFVAHGFDAAFLMALALEKAGGDKNKLKDALRSVANAPGEKIYPGEWKKAKKLLAQGKDINYEGAAGNADFDKNGDVSGLFSFNEPTANGFKSTKIIK